MVRAGRKLAPAVPSERRDSILDAALRCFVERGYHGTAIPDIAGAAGISAGTIYHYFVNKEALVNALFRHWKGEIARRVYTGFPSTAPPRDQFRAVWNEMYRFAMAHPIAFGFLELHNHASYLDAESQALDRSLKEFGRQMVQNAQAQGVIKPGLPAMVLMELVFGAFNGMMRAHVEGRLDATAEIVAGAEIACWDAVRSSPPHGQGDLDAPSLQRRSHPG